MKDFSPEERLLRLIKGSKKKDISERKVEINTEHPANLVQPKDAPPYHKSSRPQAAKSISLSLPFKLREFNIQAINLLLIIFLLGLLSYFAFDLFYNRSYGKKEVDVASEYDKRILESDEDVLAVQPSSYYSSPIGKRNIFMPQQVVATPTITGPGLEEVSASLSLIGIIAGNRPQAIIEEKKTGKSYFLYKGGTVGQAKVMEILEDSVVMEYQDQRFELVL